MNMGGNNDPIFNENDEGLNQDVAHPESGDTNVENFNNVNSNTNTSNVKCLQPIGLTYLLTYYWATS